jgi:hypothetical protein
MNNKNNNQNNKKTYFSEEIGWDEKETATIDNLLVFTLEAAAEFPVTDMVIQYLSSISQKLYPISDHTTDSNYMNFFHFVQPFHLIKENVVCLLRINASNADRGFFCHNYKLTWSDVHVNGPDKVGVDKIVTELYERISKYVPEKAIRRKTLEPFYKEFEIMKRCV